MQRRAAVLVPLWSTGRSVVERRLDAALTDRLDEGAVILVRLAGIFDGAVGDGIVEYPVGTGYEDVRAFRTSPSP